MQKQKLIAIVVVVAALAAGIYVYKYGNFGALGVEQKTENKNASALGGENPVEKGTLTEEYLSPDYGFSFKYPKDFNVTELDDDSGHTVLVQPSAPSSPSEKSYEVEPRKGFQIFISEFDEEGTLTGARILQDLPASEVIDPKDVLIGEGKTINAVIFLSTNPSFGKTREIWFVREGFLYQVTTYEGQDNLIGPILETFRFQ